MSGELEVARSGRSGDAADLAEVCVAKRRCWIREGDLVPDVDAVHLEDKGTDVLWQIEAFAQRGVEVLVAGTPQGERCGARRIADQIDWAAGLGDVGRVLELRRVNVLDRRAARPDSDIAGAGSCRGRAVASVDACVDCARYDVGHALPLQRKVGGIAEARDHGDRCTGTVGVDSGDRPSACQRAHEHEVTAFLVLAEGKLVSTDALENLGARNRGPRALDAVLVPALAAARDGRSRNVEPAAE